MSAQQQLLKLPATANNLTFDQLTAWNLIRSTKGGCYAEEVGAAVHAANGRHEPDVFCDWCCDRGRSLMRSKRLRELVIYRRKSHKFEARNPADRAREAMGAIPW